MSNFNLSLIFYPVLLIIIVFFVFVFLKIKKEKNTLIVENLHLKEDQEKYKKVEKLKEEFITTVAHQIRTPLTRVKWAIQTVMNGDVGKINNDQKEALYVGYEANDRIVGLVNDLINVDKLEDGYSGYNFENTLLENVISKVVREFNPLAKQKKIKLDFLSMPEPLSEVSIDAYKIGLALSNLIDNAIAYTPEGGKIEVILKSLGDSAIVSVKDTGIGIPKEELSKVFTRFFRAKNAVRVRTDGSGLGLYIAKKIIEGHSGKTWVESEENKGTTFNFTVPFSINKTNGFTDGLIKSV